MTNGKRNKKILKGLFVIGLMLVSIVPISAIGGETNPNLNDSDLTDKISKYLSNEIKLDQNVWRLHPGDSIDETVDKAKDGDTILLDSGDYKTASCTIDKSITLKASGIGGNPILSKRSKGTIITLSKANFKLEGLTINGSNDNDGILIRSNANATINNCNITNTKNSLGEEYM